MAWTAPTTRSSGDLVTAAIYNTDLVDNLSYLKANTKTKEFWVPATSEYFSGADTPLTNVGVAFPAAQCSNLNDIAFVGFMCPADFTAITEAKLIVLPLATQAAANWDLTSSYAAVGQAYNTHTGSDAATTYNVTQNQFFAVDVAGLLASLAAGDIVGISIKESTAGHNFALLGLYLKYS